MSTKKTYKSLSRCERLNCPDYKPKDFPRLEEHYSFATEQIVNENTNRVTKRMVKKLDNPDPYKHIKVSDFCLENLQASGAIDNIKPCSLSHDVHTTLSSLEQSAHNIINSSKTD